MQSNLDPLMQEVRQQLERWQRLKISWFGRVAAIKMKILLKFLFLFQAVVLWLTKSKLRQIQRMIENFVWAGKKARVSSNSLQKPKEGVGLLAFPNIERYYYAALMAYIVHWFDQEDNSWDLEQLHIEIPLKEWCLLAEQSQN